MEFAPAITGEGGDLVRTNVPDVVGWRWRERCLASQQDNGFLGSTHQLDAALNLSQKWAKGATLQIQIPKSLKEAPVRD